MSEGRLVKPKIGEKKSTLGGSIFLGCFSFAIPLKVPVGLEAFPRYASTSPRVSIPCTPVPLIVLGSETLFTTRSRCTDGKSGRECLTVGCVAGGACKTVYCVTTSSRQNYVNIRRLLQSTRRSNNGLLTNCILGR